MSNARDIKIEDRPYDESDASRVVRTTVQYWQRRGYYLTAMPITLTENGFSCFVMSGKHVLLEPSNRFNAKTLRHWADTIKSDERYEQLIADIVEQETVTP